MERRNVLVQKRPEDRVQGTESSIIKLEKILRQCKKETLTPYHPSAWAEELSKHGLSQKYPCLPEDLIQGFDVGIPLIKKTYSPCNNPSINLLPHAYSEITEKEFLIGQYLGPFSEHEVEDLIGPFQSSPLSFVI